MPRATIELRIAGKAYRVMSSAPEAEVRRLGGVVAATLARVSPKAGGPDEMLLAALSLAHELEAERERRAEIERRTRDLLRRAVMRIDDALDGDEAEAVQAQEQ
jgi:cell division protein ZapA